MSATLWMSYSSWVRKNLRLDSKIQNNHNVHFQDTVNQQFIILCNMQKTARSIDGDTASVVLLEKQQNVFQREPCVLWWRNMEEADPRYSMFRYLKMQLDIYKFRTKGVSLPMAFPRYHCSPVVGLRIEQGSPAAHLSVPPGIFQLEHWMRKTEMANAAQQQDLC